MVNDSKLKELIAVCRETDNYKKLAVVSFIITSNLLDEIGMKLGLRPRNRENGEKIYQYAKIINHLLSKNLGITLIDEEQILTVETMENEFLEKKGNVPLKYSRKMFKFYYDLRKLYVPNVREVLEPKFLNKYPDLKFYSSLRAGSFKKSNDKKGLSGLITPLILPQIELREHAIQEKLNSKFDKDLFEEFIHLKNYKKSLKTGSDKGKIKVKGALIDNLEFQRTIDNIYGYLIMGVIALLFTLGVVIVIETIVHPFLMDALSPILLTFFGFSGFLILLYKNYFKKEGSQ